MRTKKKLPRPGGKSLMKKAGPNDAKVSTRTVLTRKKKEKQ